MPVTGDFAELQALVSKFERVGEAKSSLTEGMASAYESFMESTVGAGKSPEGESWAPLASGAGASTLGSIARAACTAVATSDGISVDIPQDYASTHQKGAVIVPKTGKRLAFRGYSGMVYAKQVTIPARPFVLTSVPSGLESAFDAKGEATLEKIFGGG